MTLNRRSTCVLFLLWLAPLASQAQAGLIVPTAPDPLAPQVMGPEPEAPPPAQKAREAKPPEKAPPEGSTDGADGSVITHDNYPTQLALRPLVLPRGVFSASLSVSDTVSPAAAPGVGVSASYGFGHHLDATLSGSFLASNTVGANVFYELMGNVAVVGRVSYGFEDPTHPSALVAGFGVPVKFAFAQVLALRALDTVLNAESFYWSLITQGDGFSRGVSITKATLSLPVALEFSPLPWLSLRLSETGTLVLPGSGSDSVGRAFSQKGFSRLTTGLLVMLTFEHVDVGASASFAQVYATVNTASLGVSGFVSLRL
jgi:hypothetical protein